MNQDLCAPLPRTSTPLLESVATSIADRVQRAAPVIADSASAVDTEARFPAESIEALAQVRLLSAAVPKSLGGDGSSITQLAHATRLIGRECLSTAMVFAMHHSQALSLVRHGHTPYHTALLRRLCSDQFLVASATTEIGIGGDVRASGCAVVSTGSNAELHKTAPVISYGEHAEVILATARRTPDSGPGDQVLVACQRDRTNLRQISQWNTLGMRGTCSPGFELATKVSTEAVFVDDYDTISRETMLPVSHILWAAAWLGNADSAVSKSMSVVQTAARKAPDTQTLAATRLAELHLLWQQFSDVVAMAALRFDKDNDSKRSTISDALAHNALKINSANLSTKITISALKICGIRGYQNDTGASVGRQIRDALSASVMINDDRILANNAQLILALRGLPSDLVPTQPGKASLVDGDIV